jgi:hypothetical protein
MKLFNHLGCELSLEGEPDFVKKIISFLNINDTIRKHLKKTRIDTQMKFYKVVHIRNKIGRNRPIKAELVTDIDDEWK